MFICVCIYIYIYTLFGQFLLSLTTPSSRESGKIWGFDPSRVFVLKGEISPDKGKPSTFLTREFLLC